MAARLLCSATCALPLRCTASIAYVVQCTTRAARSLWECVVRRNMIMLQRTMGPPAFPFRGGPRGLPSTYSTTRIARGKSRN